MHLFVSLALPATAAAFSLPALQLPMLPRLDTTPHAALRASHGLSGAANWLIPGRVLLGANPTKGRGATSARVAALRRDGGCGTFVSLQAELPPIDAPAEQFAGAGAESYATDCSAESSWPPPTFVRCANHNRRPAQPAHAKRATVTRNARGARPLMQRTPSPAARSTTCGPRQTSSGSPRALTSSPRACATARCGSFPQARANP